MYLVILDFCVLEFVVGVRGLDCFCLLDCGFCLVLVVVFGLCLGVVGLFGFVIVGACAFSSIGRL